MQFEHFGINVPDARAMADWYTQHLGLRVVFALDKPPHTRFLADPAGRTVMEIYTNPADPIPDYAAQHPLRFHFAFAVADPDALAQRLRAVGARPAAEDRQPDGSIILTLRDPWNIPLQFARRATPFP